MIAIIRYVIITIKNCNFFAADYFKLDIRIRSRRNELNLSQEYMTNKLGISRQGYGHYETGRNEPDTKTLNKISEILDCSIDFLYSKTDSPIVDFYK